MYLRVDVVGVAERRPTAEDDLRLLLAAHAHSGHNATCLSGIRAEQSREEERSRGVARLFKVNESLDWRHSLAGSAVGAEKKKSGFAGA